MLQEGRRRKVGRKSEVAGKSHDNSSSSLEVNFDLSVEAPACLLYRKYDTAYIYSVV